MGAKEKYIFSVLSLIAAWSLFIFRHHGRFQTWQPVTKRFKKIERCVWVTDTPATSLLSCDSKIINGTIAWFRRTKMGSILLNQGSQWGIARLIDSKFTDGRWSGILWRNVQSQKVPNQLVREREIKRWKDNKTKKRAHR